MKVACRVSEVKFPFVFAIVNMIISHKILIVQGTLIKLL